jgi:hypothetical protein
MPALIRLKRYSLPLLLIVWLCLTGMSGMGGSEGPTRIPTPDRNYVVTVVDRADMHTRLDNFTVSGYTHFMGEMGKGKVAIPFEKIKRVDFRQVQNKLEVVVSLRNGDKVTLTAEQKQPCFGRSKVGNYEIAMGDIKMIIFEGPAVPAQPSQ